MVSFAIAGVIPVVLALIAALRIGAFGRVPRERRSQDARRWSVAEGRWEGLAEEIARRGCRARPRLSDAATRRRHLAAVLPADARR